MITMFVKILFRKSGRSAESQHYMLYRNLFIIQIFTTSDKREVPFLRRHDVAAKIRLIPLSGPAGQVAVCSRPQADVWNVVPIGAVMHRLISRLGKIGYLIVVVSCITQPVAKKSILPCTQLF